jgi:predicted O-methyltransferase YrrM
MARIRKIVSGVFKGPRTLVTDRLFPHLFAALDHRHGKRRTQAFNGQKGRTAIMAAIVHTCGIEQVVETGTYRGASTAWFAKTGAPVSTVEKNRRFAHLARLQFADKPSIHPVEMDSVAFLQTLADKAEMTAKVTLFYLDAHWERRLPLGEEIRTVAGSFPAAVMVVDDFRVEDDPDYGFDDYGPGKRLDLDYVRATGVDGLHAFFPVLRGKDESGAKRGCVVLTSNKALADKLGQISLLRPYPLAQGDARGSVDTPTVGVN